MQKECLIVLFMVIFINAPFCQQSNISTTKEKKGFRASVVKVDITPDNPQNLLGYDARISTGVLDHIYHRIVVLDDGITQFVLVSTDICLISPTEYDHVAGLLKILLGISPVNFWWTTTHTHSAPEVGKAGLDNIFMVDRSRGFQKHDCRCNNNRNKN